MKQLSSLRVKAALVFVMIGLAPAVVTGVSLVGINTAAVETTERQLQTAVLAGIAAFVELHVASVRDDLEAVAGALAVAATQDSPSLTPVKSVLAARPRLGPVRFQVAETKVDTLLRSSEPDDAPAPAPGASLLAAAAAEGFSVGLDQAGAIALTVAVLGPEGSGHGFVSARLDPSHIEKRLALIARSQFGGSNIRAVVVSGNAIVASSGLSASEKTDSENLPVWGLLPKGQKPTAGFAIIGSIATPEEPMLGGVEVVEELGWKVALWRPEAEAYSARDAMRVRAAWTAVFSVLFALGLGLFAASRLTRPILDMAQQARLIGARAWNKLKTLPHGEDELGQLAKSLNQTAEELQGSEAELERQTKLRTDLGRFMSQKLVERIVEGKHSLALGGTRSTVTVMFADVVAFTPLAERGEPEQVVALLNELFSLLTEIVFRHGGTVDKFLGDSLMAVWGAPQADDRHALNAVRAAEDMLRFVDSSNSDWSTRFGTEIHLGIGLNSGECIVGNIGSSKRMDYTVIGDVVNVAASLEKKAAPDQILLTEQTRDAAGDENEFLFAGEQQLFGRDGPVRVYELGGEL